MEFIETSAFTKQITAAMPDDSYRELQKFLMNHPDAGVVMPDCGGFRKLRWTLPRQGKRGGARVIYFYWNAGRTFYMVLAYSKAMKETLSQEDKKILRSLAKEFKK